MKFFHIFIFLLSTFAFAEDKAFEIKLKIMEKGSGVVLKRVEVKVGSQSFYSSSDGFVEFLLNGDSDGSIFIEKESYETFVITTQDLLHESMRDVYLVPKLGDDSIINVQGERRKSISKKAISAQEIRAIAPGSDPAQVVKLLPGVQQAGFRPQLIIRGSGPNDSRYFVDDMEVPFVFHSIGGLSVVPAPILSQVQFESGGFGAEYGDATGGIINLKTISDIPVRSKTEFNVNVPLFSGIYHEHPLSDDSFWAGSIRRSYLEIFIKAFLHSQKNNTGGLTISPYFQDAHLFYNKKQDDGSYKIILMAAEDGLKAAVPTDISSNENGSSEFKLSDSFVNIGLQKFHSFTRSLRVKTTPQVYFHRNYVDISSSEIFSDTTAVRAPTEFSYRISKEEDAYFGVDPLYLKTSTKSNSNLFIGEAEFDSSPTKIDNSSKENASKISLWAVVEKKFDSFLVTPGVRAFYNKEIDESATDPRLKIEYKLDEARQIKAAIGIYSKDPKPLQASKVYGNSALTFERSKHYILGYSHKWDEKYEGEIQIYKKTIANLIEGDTVLTYANKGTIQSQGFELFLRRNLTSRFFGWLSYTYSVTNTFDDVIKKYRLADYDQTHVLNLVASYKWSATWEFSTRYNYHSGDLYSPVDGGVYNVGTDRYEELLDLEKTNTERLPAYNNLTIYGKHKFLYDTWTLYSKFGLEYFWFKARAVGLQYNYDNSKKEYRTEPQAIPFIEVGGEF